MSRPQRKIRALDDRVTATRRTGRVLTELRRCPHRATTIAQAILVLHHVETNRRPG
ncbi:hypothetical protein [Micromonospora sp. NPDC049891]|uniref:hypothetical protein n=1 Tax=Micromonospora sp. NPDC049891 TaxID=3155655 RepID=UPI0033C1D5D0